MTDQRNAPRPAGVTMRQLRAFVAVAQDESITRAAQRLHLTPSALSMLISSLEGELAVRLFERTTRRIALTDAGLELLPSIKKVFENLDDAFDGLRQLSDRRSGRFAVATSPLLAATLLPPLLAGFRVRFPGIRVDLFDLPVDGIAQAVRSGQADFGVCTADTEMPGLVLTTLYQDRLMLACQSDHPLAERREVRWAELAGEPLALLRHGSGLRSLVERGFSEIGEPVQPAFEVAHVTTAVGLVEAGLAVSILPSYALSSARSPGVVAVPLTAPVMERNIVALTDGQRQLSAPCEAFLTHFKSGVTGLAASSSQKKNRKKPAGRA
ncbi:LysR substrate-binding domain-containing protein [Polaromonas sp.]|uniref:LysR family transcriptional regulator n=1 Tax=Polaromonas sp. TaxID=1869339 RepID=UPI003BAD078D